MSNMSGSPGEVDGAAGRGAATHYRGLVELVVADSSGPPRPGPIVVHHHFHFRLDRASQAGGDDGDAQVLAQVGIVDGAHYDRAVRSSELADGIAHQTELANAKTIARGHVDYHATGAAQVDVVEQRAVDGGLRGLPGAIVSRGLAGAHDRQSALGHHGSHVGEVHIDPARPEDDVGNALHGAAQHVVRGRECRV